MRVFLQAGKGPVRETQDRFGVLAIEKKRLWAIFHLRILFQGNLFDCAAKVGEVDLDKLVGERDDFFPFVIVGERSESRVARRAPRQRTFRGAACLVAARSGVARPRLKQLRRWRRGRSVLRAPNEEPDRDGQKQGADNSVLFIHEERGKLGRRLFRSIRRTWRT